MIGSKVEIGGVALALALFLGCAETGREAPAEVQDETKVLYVADRRAECVGVAPMHCLRIRESPDEDWRLWYSGIEGLDYQEGSSYRIRVREEKVENPPPDASSLRLVLVEVLEMEQTGTGVAAVEAGSAWRLTSFGEGGGGPDVHEGEAAPTLEFAAEGQLGGFAGCNNYFASYETGEDDTFTMGQAGSTRKMCPPEMMEIETAFLQGLGAVAAFEKDGETLRLLDETGGTLFEFERMEVSE